MDFGGERPFLLTRLLRGVTFPMDRGQKRPKISTHTPLARRDLQKPQARAGASGISTHTPLARRDAVAALTRATKFFISTHTPLARRDSPRWRLPIA